MLTRRIQTKTEKICEHLREEILSERFPDGQLPSKLELAEHFQVSHQTIDTVLKRLREEGLVRGVRGTGIFVNREFGDVSNLTPRLVLMLLAKYSVYEEEPYQELRLESFRRGLFPINLSIPNFRTMSLLERATLTQLLRAPIRGVLYNGRNYQKTPFLDNWRNLRSVALVIFDSENDLPGSSVLLDFEAGAEKIARHFIKNGCRKLLVLASYVSPGTPKSEKYWKNHVSSQFMRGVTRVAADAGIAAPDLRFPQYYDSTMQSAPLSFKEFASFARNYDGIICTTDNLAFAVLQHAEQLGIRVPDNLLVSGTYNTGWSSQFGREITTIGLNETEISRKAFQILEDGGIHHEKVEPDIIIRASSNR